MFKPVLLSIAIATLLAPAGAHAGPGGEDHGGLTRQQQFEAKIDKLEAERQAIAAQHDRKVARLGENDPKRALYDAILAEKDAKLVFKEQRIQARIDALGDAPGNSGSSRGDDARDHRREDRQEDRREDRRDDRQADRREDRRVDRREDRVVERSASRAERAERVERPERVARAERIERPERPERSGRGRS